MSKTIRTISGSVYIVTLSQPGTISTETIDGTSIVLASSNTAGQISFQAIGLDVTCSDDDAIVLPVSTPEQTPLPEKGVTADQVTEMLDSALFDQQEIQTRTAQGTDNYNASWFMLDAQHVPTGTLTAISIPCRTNSTGANITYDPVYLTLQIQSASGGDNWEPLAVSTNTVVQAINATGRWEFDNVPLDGRDVRACLNTAPTGEWNTGLTMGLRVSSRPAGDTSTVGGASYLADVTIETAESVSKFTSADHATDSTIHITDAERQSWNAKADASDLGTKVNSSTFTAHTGDTVAHLSSDEHTAITELIESGGGGGSIAIDDTPTKGSTNAVSSGGVYAALLMPGSGTNSTAVGTSASASSLRATAVGTSASASSSNATAVGTSASASSLNATAVGTSASAIGQNATAVGFYASASENCAAALGVSAKASNIFATSLGHYSNASGSKAAALGATASAKAESSTALGSGGYVNDSGVTILNAGGTVTDGKSTQLYLIPAGSTMASNYTNGDAGLGYVVLDHLSGSVVARGTIPLASICTQHTDDFSPTDVTSISDY